jgi:hypothetical protein
VRLPDSQELGQAFGWKAASHQPGATGTRYPEARWSVVFDLLNRIGLDARLEPSTVGEVALARQQLEHLPPGEVEINDRGFAGYLYLASVGQWGRHFIARGSTGSFLAAQERFRLNRANPSKVVWRFAPPDPKAQCRRLGLPVKMRVRFVSLRLPSGELAVLATSLWEEAPLSHGGVFDGVPLALGTRDLSSDAQGPAGTGELQRPDRGGRPAGCAGGGATGQLGSVLSEPTQAALSQQSTPQTQPLQVNRSNSFHALKDQVLDLLYRDVPIPTVIRAL